MDLFLQQLASMRGANILVLCHDHADSDAVGAAYAMAKFINGTIGVPHQVAAHVNGLIDHLSIDVKIKPDPHAYDYVIVVDTAHPSQLVDCMPEKFLLIDHHPANMLVESATESLYDTVSSTCQLVYRLLKRAGYAIESDVALALCAGIMTDTVNFHKGDPEAFQTFGELMQAVGITYDDVQALYVVDQRRDRKMIIQAALQAKHVEIEGYEILVTEIQTNIPTFAARALFDLGADMSVVGYKNQTELEIRMYLRYDLIEQFGLHAADILKRADKVQSQFVWGYSLFAGYRGKGHIDEVLQSILETAQQVLKEQT